MDFIKANRAAVEGAIRDKGVGIDLAAVLALDERVRAARQEIEALRAERNAVSAKFKDAAPEEKAELGRTASVQTIALTAAATNSQGPMDCH